MLMFFTLHVRIKSSANRFPWTEGFIPLIISLMPFRNRIALIADSCSTPFCIIVELKRYPLILTWMYQFFKKFFMKASIFSFISNEIRVFMILVLCIVSYAFSMSRHTLIRCSLFRNASHMLVSMFIKMSVVDRYYLKPY